MIHRDSSELPEDFRETPIGPRLDVFKAILTFPGSRESGEGNINIETDGYAIEISVGKEDVCAGLMFKRYKDYRDEVLKNAGADKKRRP